MLTGEPFTHCGPASSPILPSSPVSSQHEAAQKHSPGLATTCQSVSMTCKCRQRKAQDISHCHILRFHPRQVVSQRRVSAVCSFPLNAAICSPFSHCRADQCNYQGEFAASSHHLISLRSIHTTLKRKNIRRQEMFCIIFPASIIRKNTLLSSISMVKAPLMTSIKQKKRSHKRIFHFKGKTGITRDS